MRQPAPVAGSMWPVAGRAVVIMCCSARAISRSGRARRWSRSPSASAKMWHLSRRVFRLSCRRLSPRSLRHEPVLQHYRVPVLHQLRLSRRQRLRYRPRLKALLRLTQPSSPQPLRPVRLARPPAPSAPRGPGLLRKLPRRQGRSPACAQPTLNLPRPSALSAAGRWRPVTRSRPNLPARCKPNLFTRGVNPTH